MGAAPKTPLFYYHIPGFSGVSLPMAEFLQEGGKSIPTLAGIKYSSADFGELAQMLAVKSPKGKASRSSMEVTKRSLRRLALVLTQLLAAPTTLCLRCFKDYKNFTQRVILRR